MLKAEDLYGKRYTKDDFLFFCGHTGTGKACLSQWYPSPFVVDGVCYNCTEQYMMARKALMFGDEETLAEIMASYNPMVIKKLGRRVRNFNFVEWDARNRDVVKEANLAKFSQNPKLRDFLLSTEDRIIVEASPYDTIWGIGMAADDPEACRPERWKGENRLGFALMAVRDMLRGQGHTK